MDFLTTFLYSRLRLAVKNGAGVRHWLPKSTHSAQVVSQSIADIQKHAKHLFWIVSCMFATREFSTEFRLAIRHSV